MNSACSRAQCGELVSARAGFMCRRVLVSGVALSTSPDRWSESECIILAEVAAEIQEKQALFCSLSPPDNFKCLSCEKTFFFLILIISR